MFRTLDGGLSEKMAVRLLLVACLLACVGLIVFDAQADNARIVASCEEKVTSLLHAKAQDPLLNKSELESEAFSCVRDLDGYLYGTIARMQLHRAGIEVPG
jgi:hypothetical protein